VTTYLRREGLKGAGVLLESNWEPNHVKDNIGLWGAGREPAGGDA